MTAITMPDWLGPLVAEFATPAEQRWVGITWMLMVVDGEETTIETVRERTKANIKMVMG